MVTNGCKEQTNQETGEYVEELKNVPGFPLDNKTEIKPDMETNDRSELFRVLESSEDSQDDHLSILTSELNINKETLGDTTESIQLTKPGSGKEPASMEPAPSSPYLDALSQLILTYEEAIKADQACGSCNMSTTNLQKHLDINKCKLMPFQESKGKKKRDKLRRKHGKQ